jgi:hypothetical protein
VNAALTESATAQQHDTDKPSSVAVPLIVWLLVQLAAVALAASGVGLSASVPQPRSLAVHDMLVAQFVGSAMFAGVLFRGGWRGWLALVVSAAAMLMLAAWLARIPMARVPMLWVHVAAWLTMLALWHAVGSSSSSARASHSRGFLSVLSALAMLFSGGGLLLWYLQSEFQPDRRLTLLHFVPLPALLQSPAEPFASPVVLPLLSTTTLALPAAVILTVNRSFRRANA